MDETLTAPAHRASLNRLGIFSQDGAVLGYVLLPVPGDPARMIGTLRQTHDLSEPTRHWR